MDFQKIFFLALRFWPGFQRLWFKGDFHSLMVSLLFGWVLLLVWMATFVWPEFLSKFVGPVWFSQILLKVTWLAIGVSAFLAAIRPGVLVGNMPGKWQAEQQNNLEMAQEFYLQANYFEAERLIRKNMVGGREDVESSLLWIAILRRTRRISQALELISNTDRLDAALPWLTELRSEKEQCLRIKIQTPPAHD